MLVRRALQGAVVAAMLAGTAPSPFTSLRPAGADPAPPARLTWYGQSFFVLESATGTRVAMDPFGAGTGYALPQDLRVDAVTVSHEHPDHNNVALVTSQKKARVLRGLTADRKGWVKIDEKVKDVSIRSVGVYHDDDSGAQRGLNTVFVYEVGGLRIAHLGDLGHLLTDRQLADIGSVDAVLVPVGGVFTVDAQQAARVADQLRPRLVVVPMHHRTQTSSIKELADVEAFAAGRPHVRRQTDNTLVLTGIKKRPWSETVVLSAP